MSFKRKNANRLQAVKRSTADAQHYRVGLILPSSNNALEWEFARRLPRWCSLHPQRMFHVDADFASLQRTHDALPEAAKVVATVRPHLMVVGCTAVSGLDHGEFEQQVVPRIAAAVNAPVITVLPAVIEWLRRRRCEHIVLVTPHGADIDAVLVQALANEGIGVRETHSMEIRDNFALGQVPPSRIVSFVSERMKSPLGPRDALFLSCTNFRSCEALPALQALYGPRVITSIKAVIDSTLLALKRLRAQDAASDRAHPPRPTRASDFGSAKHHRRSRTSVQGYRSQPRTA